MGGGRGNISTFQLCMYERSAAAESSGSSPRACGQGGELRNTPKTLEPSPNPLPPPRPQPLSSSWTPCSGLHKAGQMCSL